MASMRQTISLGVDDLAVTRFAVSSLAETVFALQFLRTADANPVNRPWLRQARQDLSRRPLSLPLLWPLLRDGRRSRPEFLTPAPAERAPSLTAELDRMLATTPGQVRASLERVFGCPVEFEAEQNEIYFDPALLEYRSPRWDPDLLRLHEELAEKRLSSIERQDLIERIRTVFSRKLELEQCDLEDVARELDVPARRLRFELARAGTSFSQLLSDFRYALARKLLRSTDEPIEHIVYLTGFSEPSTFYRAFKRWSGMTPVQYREQKRATNGQNGKATADTLSAIVGASRKA